MADGTAEKDSLKGNDMSHYAVAVFSDKPEDIAFDSLLEPYSEIDSKYQVFTPMTAEKIQERWEKFHVNNPKYTYEEYMKAMYDYSEEEESYGYFYNPNSKYDYYTLRAKDYMFEPLPGEKPDGLYYKKSQIDWYAEDDEYDESEFKKMWKEYSECGDGFYNERYYKDRYGSMDQFIKEMMRPTTPYAFVTPDGEWHAPGNVGYFATSDDTAESADKYWEEWVDFIDNAPDCYVTICDMHA